MSTEKAWFCQKCRVMMEPVSEDFCRCPECGSEVWYSYSQDRVAGPPATDGSYVSLSLQPGENIMGGGASTGKPKKQGKKKSLAQINAELGRSNRGTSKLFDA